MNIAYAVIRRALFALMVLLGLCWQLSTILSAAREVEADLPIWSDDVYLPITSREGTFSDPFKAPPIAEPTATPSTVQLPSPTSTLASTPQQTTPTSTAQSLATATPVASYTNTPVATGASPAPTATAGELPVSTPTLVPPTQSPTPSPTPASTDTSDSTEKERIIVEKLNEQRASNNVGALLISDPLIVAARRHSADMARNNHTNHTGSDGSSGGDRMEDAGYIWMGWGEILAWGYDTEYDELIADWMRSPAHRAVILEPFFEDIGVGQLSDSNSVHNQYWTANLGTRLNATAQAAAYPYLCVIRSGNTARGSIVVLRSATPC